MKGLKEVGYNGSLNFEAFLGIGNFPEEVQPFALKTLGAIGKYFSKLLTD